MEISTADVFEENKELKNQLDLIRNMRSAEGTSRDFCGGEGARKGGRSQNKKAWTNNYLFFSLCNTPSTIAINIVRAYSRI